MRTLKSTEAAWMDTKEAGEYLGLTTRTLYRLIDIGPLQGYRFGRVIRLRRDDLDEFICQSRSKRPRR